MNRLFPGWRGFFASIAAAATSERGPNVAA